MEIEIISGLSEFGFRLVRTIIKYFNFLSHVPYLKYLALGLGAFIVFIKRYIAPKSWKTTKRLG